MTREALKNVAASVHARLLNHSRRTGEDFQFLLQRYAAERFLFRLGLSSYRERFVLKGAMLFALWGGSIYRATRDLDFTGYGTSGTEAVLSVIRHVCGLATADDGLTFDASSVTGESIRDEADYEGLRVRFLAVLGTARVPMQLDIGFGDLIQPAAVDVEYPALLDGPPPYIRVYPREAVVAEKIHAIHRFGEANTRLKDFYDLYVLSDQFDFDGQVLGRAISGTFERRKTSIEPVLPVWLTARFYLDDGRGAQWRAYLQRNSLAGASSNLEIVGERLQTFLRPVWSALVDRSSLAATWRRTIGWQMP